MKTYRHIAIQLILLLALLLDFFNPHSAPPKLPSVTPRLRRA